MWARISTGVRLPSLARYSPNPSGALRRTLAER